MSALKWYHIIAIFALGVGFGVISPMMRTVYFYVQELEHQGTTLATVCKALY